MPLKYALCMETEFFYHVSLVFSVNQVALTLSRQPRVQEKLRVFLKDKMLPKIPPYSIYIGTHTDKNMHCGLKGCPDIDCILLSFMAANQQRCVSSKVLAL